MSNTAPRIVALVVIVTVGLGIGLSRAQTPAANGPLVFQRFAGPREDDHSSQLVTRTIAGVERQITHFAGGAFQPAWSPDASRIAFSRWFTRTHQPDQIYTSAADGSDVRRLTSGCTPRRCLADANPSWSPDGSQVAFVRLYKPLVRKRFNRYDQSERPKSADIMITSAGGGSPKLVRHFGGDLQGSEGAVTWSPDGTQIVFAASSFKHTNKHTRVGTALFMMSATGQGALRRISPWDIGAGNPHFSPDGSLIAFNSQGGHSPGIYTVRADGSGVKLVVKGNQHGGVGPALYPSWSPDGTQIVFAAPPKLGNFARADIYAVSPDGSNLHALVKSTRMESAPSWGPAR